MLGFLFLPYEVMICLNVRKLNLQLVVRDSANGIIWGKNWEERRSGRDEFLYIQEGTVENYKARFKKYSNITRLQIVSKCA